MNLRLQTKDLITVGIFTAIYFVLFFAVGMIGYIPILYVLLPFILPIITGVPFMLFLTKVKAFGMVTIMGTILGSLMVLTGHTFVPALAGMIFGLASDLIFMTGGYRSKKTSVLGYGVFSLWLLGMLVPFWIMKDSFEKMMLDSMGVEYTRAVMGLFEKVSWTFPILAFAGGMAGAFFGLATLKKHFKKAGIV
jgi:energy-coupling factor transport system substrate-specific component